MVTAVPRRIEVALEVLAPAPDSRLLEVGPGPGVAMALVCRRLTDGHITGLDRSATAIARAEKRLARYLDAGLADLQHRDLAHFHGDGRPFDQVFAINVNAFWTGPARVEVTRLRELVADTGVVHLLVETPGGTVDRRVLARAAAALEPAGFTVSTDVVDGIGCVTGMPRPTPP